VKTYFDHNATSPLGKAALTAFLENSSLGNPGTLHNKGTAAHRILEDARSAVAKQLGTDGLKIVFTSGATEAISATIRYWSSRYPKRKIAITPFEHICVNENTRIAFDNRVLVIPPKVILNPEQQLASWIKSHPECAAMVTTAAHNESGLILPLPAIIKICSEAKMPHLIDAAQWIGRLPTKDMGTLGSWIASSAHKYGGPGGIGWLQLGENHAGFCITHGGGQENEFRSGTPAVPLIASMVAQWTHIEGTLLENYNEKILLRNQFEGLLCAAIPGARIIAQAQDRLWNTTAVVMPTHNQIRWQKQLDRLGFSVGTGAACSTHSQQPSLGLMALGLSQEETHRVIRISSGWENTATDYKALLKAMSRVSKAL
jgi:cysteine desulfurase